MRSKCLLATESRSWRVSQAKWRVAGEHAANLQFFLDNDLVAKEK